MSTRLWAYTHKVQKECELGLTLTYLKNIAFKGEAFVKAVSTGPYGPAMS